MLAMSAYLILLFMALLVSLDGSPKCHLEYPSAGGLWKDEPPYWKPTGCISQPFSVNATSKCLKGRTFYALGNSVGRQAAFGMVSLLGGDTVGRADQKEECPKHEVVWGDSCHQELAGVKIKYLFLNFIDGFNYSSRGGFPYCKYKTINDTYVTGTLPGINTPNECTHEVYYDVDNCINSSTRVCLSNFFRGSTDTDILVFNVGMMYELAPEQELIDLENAGKLGDRFVDKKAWLIASLTNFKAHIESTFHGYVFWQTLSTYHKKYWHSSHNTWLYEVNKIASQYFVGDVEKKWYVVDQWAINQNRDHMYNDHVHFNGNLEQAALFQVLNTVCPGQGDNSVSANMWPNMEYAATLVCTKTNGTSCYFGSETGSVQKLDGLPFYLKNVTPKWVNDTMEGVMKTNLAAPHVEDGMLVRKPTGQAIYLISNLTSRVFTNADVFIRLGYDFQSSKIVPIPASVFNLIPKGSDLY